MYRMRFGFAVLMVALLASITATAISVGAAETFTDPQNRFAFAVPDGWQQDTTASGSGVVVQYRTANPDGAFNVTAAPLPDGVTFDMVPQLIVARLQMEYGDFLQTNLIPATVAGEQGMELDYTATNSDGTLLAVAQIMVPHKGTLYLLTLAARPADIAAIQTAGLPIVQSWQWSG